jgi:hypothetical protein
MALDLLRVAALTKLAKLVAHIPPQSKAPAIFQSDTEIALIAE